MMWKATEKGLAEFELVNLRDYGLGPHKSVDDTPYGGGDGMLLRCEPVFAAIEAVKAKDPDAKVILPTPVGRVWNQKMARALAGVADNVFFKDICRFSSSETYIPDGAEKAARRADFPGRPAYDVEDEKVRPEKDMSDRTPAKHYIILCPHYEGYDERIMSIVDYPISLGKYVLTGGELPALIIIDSVVRLIPGVLGGESSAEIESFSDGDNLEYPQYTRPEDFRGMKVPEVLLSGHHGNIAKWREAHTGKLGQDQ